VIHILVAASQEFVKLFSTRRRAAAAPNLHSHPGMIICADIYIYIYIYIYICYFYFYFFLFLFFTNVFKRSCMHGWTSVHVPLR